VQSLGADKDREAKPSYAQLSPRVCEFRSLLAFVARDVDDVDDKGEKSARSYDTASRNLGSIETVAAFRKVRDKQVTPSSHLSFSMGFGRRH
jgi:hypothetical protein